MSNNKIYTTIFTLIIGWFTLSGCGASQVVDTPMPSPSPTIQTTPTPALSPEEEKIWAVWRRSMHARGETDISCETCHQAGMAEQGEKMTGEVCVECHFEAAEMQAQVDDHHSQLDCIVCHDPHVLTGSCATSGCHPNVAEDLEILNELAVAPGHETGEQHACGSGHCHVVATAVAKEGRLTHIGTQHTFLSCAACHDALGYEVGPLDNNIDWNTWLPASADQITLPFASHAFQREVQCERCHYKDNPWKLRFPAGKQ